jgi:hypothetical protein
VADTKAITAWQAGAKGQGVLVAVIDDGVDASHPELAGRISPASRDINTARNQLFSVTETHGSELTAIIAGNFNNQSTIGLAYDATVLAVRADNGAGTFSANDLANSVDYAIAQGARIINFSLGSASPSSPVFQAAIQRATTAGIVIVVSAGNDGPFAGEVNHPGFLATNPAVSNNLIMVAGAHDQSGSQVSFSNRAGQAQNFYLTAPGLEIVVPDFGDPGGPVNFQVCPPPGGDVGTCRVQGTSYSAPYLTGTMALVLGAFPSLTPQQAVQLVLNAADDYGAPGVDAVVGHGRLNIARAFAPAGPVSTPLSKSVEMTAGGMLGVTGGAFGDGLTEDPRLWRTVGFDTYGRTFSVDLARSWRTAGRTAPGVDAPMLWRTAEAGDGYAAFASEDRSAPETLRSSLDGADATWFAFRTENALSLATRVSVAANTSALTALAGADAAGHLAFAGQGMAIAAIHALSPGAQVAFTAQGDVFDLGPGLGRSARQAFAGRLSAVQGPLAAALSVGAVREEGAILGLAWTRRLGARPDSETAFVGVEGVWRAPAGIALSARGEMGQVQRSDGWLGVVEPLHTTTFAIGAALDATPAFLVDDDATGRIALTVRQPLRIESGAMQTVLATADNWGRSSLAWEARRFDPAPSGRELEFEAAWDLRLTSAFSAHASVAYVREPGHVADAASDARASIGMRVSY